MPGNQHVFKVVDGDNEEGRGKSRGLTLNRVTLVGRLAGGPKLHYTPRGSPVTQLRLATNEGEEPEFHALSAWGKLAKFAGSYLKKGGLVYLEGRLHWSTWQAADGSSQAQLRGQGQQPSGSGPATGARRAVGR